MRRKDVAEELQEIVRIINLRAKVQGEDLQTVDYATAIEDIAIQVSGESQIASNGAAFRGCEATIPIDQIRDVEHYLGSSSGSGYTVRLVFKAPVPVRAYAFKYGMESLTGQPRWNTRPWTSWDFQFEAKPDSLEVAQRLRRVLGLLAGQVVSEVSQDDHLQDFESPGACLTYRIVREED